MWVESLILIAICGVLLYKWAYQNKNYFKDRNVTVDEFFPLLGSLRSVFLRKESILDAFITLYNKYPDSKVVGIFDGKNPMFMLRDPDIIRQVTVKDFDHFINHRSVFNDEDGGLFGNSLFVMTDQKWKDMRSTLSPAFTGSKMRLMYELIREVADQTMVHLKKQPDSKTGIELDIKDYFTHFTNDIIASTAFGLKINSLEDDKNEFYTIGKKITNFNAWMNIKFFLFVNFKALVKLLRLELFDKKYSDYFMRLVLGSMKYRSEHKIIRPDMINMLMEAKGMGITEDGVESPKATREWTDTEIVAQCFLFFFAGFETAAVFMCFTAHELMENPEVQAKLREEIEEVKASLNGKPLTYEALNSMKYLDAVVSETLRKWPPAVGTDRVCNADFTFDDPDCGKITIKKGEAISIPISGIQNDPKYYPNPKVFDPERFMSENKGASDSFIYMPFGVGPRKCIANRFALLETKAIIYYLVSEFEILAAKKTTVPLKLSTSGFQLKPTDGFWLKLVERK